MSNDEPDACDSIDRRTERALTEPLSVLTPDGTPVEDPDATIVAVVSHSGASYTVDVRAGRCECPDAEHRNPDGGCKHVRRARVALGREPVAARVLDTVDPDPQLGANAPGPAVATADGGIVDAGDDAVILDDGRDDDDDAGRPDGCACAGLGGELECFACHLEGFDEPNPDPPERDE